MFVSRWALLLVAFVLAFPLACDNDEGDPVGASGGSSNDDAPSPELVCPDFDGAAFPEMALLGIEKASFAAPLLGNFSASAGAPSYSFSL